VETRWRPDKKGYYKPVSCMFLGDYNRKGELTKMRITSEALTMIEQLVVGRWWWYEIRKHNGVHCGLGADSVRRMFTSHDIERLHEDKDKDIST
jgi:hypothetical protein